MFIAWINRGPGNEAAKIICRISAGNLGKNRKSVSWRSTVTFVPVVEVDVFSVVELGEELMECGTTIAILSLMWGASTIFDVSCYLVLMGVFLLAACITHWRAEIWRAAPGVDIYGTLHCGTDFVFGEWSRSVLQSSWIVNCGAVRSAHNVSKGWSIRLVKERLTWFVAEVGLWCHSINTLRYKVRH